MKRRDVLKTAAALAVTPFVSPLANAVGFSTRNSNPEDQLKSLSEIKRFGDGRDWFFEKRYGMFIHWGLYSIPGWHEQHQ